MDRVSKVLSISEYPEFLLSGSHSENSMHNKVVYSDNNAMNLKNLDNYYQKVLTSGNVDIITKKAVFIEQQLKQIQNYEKVLSNLDKYKDKVSFILNGR
jgi:hypothetical protein